MHILDSVDAASLRNDIPDFRAGDNVKVHVNIVEGTRSRVQVFQGVVIGRSGEGIRIDMDAASNIVAVHLETAQLPGELVGTPTVELGPRPGTVVVRAQLRIDHFFGAVVPGAPDSEIVTVEVTGEVLEL